MIAGDTANVFFLLSLLAPYKLNVFVIDTGVEGTSSIQFRQGTRGQPDVAVAYYDFFSSPYGIGAGIIRRMDLVLYTAGRGYISGWARSFRVPAAYLKRRPEGIIFEIEGAFPDAGGIAGRRGQDPAVSALLLSLVDAAVASRYAGSSSIAVVDMNGGGRAYPPVERKLPPEIVPEETACSAWDSIVEVLEPDESIVVDQPDSGGLMRIGASPSPGPKLIELGIPELHVLKINGPHERHIELTGDLPRVFDCII